MVVDGIQKYHSIDGFQRMLLSLFGDLVCDPADRAARDRNAVDVLDGGLDVTGGHIFGVHGQDFLLNILTDAGLILFQDLEFEFAFSIARDRYLHIPKAGAQGLAAVTVAAAVCVFIPAVILAVVKFVVQFCL